ncbi:MAG TPA: hypothetical protein VGO09_00850 [Flavisolibacter sp.]|jgi:hypothetical protein|nr:hypothetical protein [Flavisolibacter sp.]
MKANLDEIAQFVRGQWYSENGKILYEFEQVDDDYLGNTSITLIPRNELEQSTYLLTTDNNRIYIIIGENEYTIEELDEHHFIYQKDKQLQVLLRNL